MRSSVRGALVGWKREPAEHGIRLTLQVANSVGEYQEQRYKLVELALNDRQLRSLARDLTRAAGGRGMTLFHPRGALARLLRR